MCPLIFELLSVTFVPETAEIRWLIVAHPISSHYVAIIIVATCLVELWFKVLFDIKYGVFRVVSNINKILQ